MPARRLLDDGLRIDYGGLCGIDVSLSLIDLAKGGGIDLRNQLAFRHFGVDISEQSENDAGLLRAHLHRNDRVRVTGGRNGSYRYRRAPRAPSGIEYWVVLGATPTPPAPRRHTTQPRR